MNLATTPPEGAPKIAPSVRDDREALGATSPPAGSGPRGARRSGAGEALGAAWSSCRRPCRRPTPVANPMIYGCSLLSPQGRSQVRMPGENVSPELSRWDRSLLRFFDRGELV